MNTNVDIDELRCFFESEPDISFAYIFGSQALGNAGPLSDIDIAVFLDKSFAETHYLDKQSEVLGRLTTFLRTNKVDLIILNEAPLLLAHRVLKNGTAVFCRDTVQRVRFETRIVRDYLDTKPLRNAQTRYLFKRVKEGRFAS